MAQYELNFQDYFRIVNKRKWTIFLCAFTVIVSVIIFTNLQTPLYKASATLKIESSLVIQGVSTDQASWDVYTALNTEVKLIKSTLVAEKTAQKLGLLTEDRSKAEKEEIINDLRNKIDAERVGDTNLIVISAFSADPRETAHLANTVAEVYIEKGMEDKSRHARELREFIETQLKEAEQKLRASEESLKVYSEKSGAKGVGALLSTRLSDLQTKKSELLKKYTELHPDVQQVNQQIRSIENQMRSLPSTELEFERLNRDVHLNEELYTLLSTRFKEAQISEADKVRSAFIITPATVPGSPIKPNKLTNISIGIFAGLFLGFLFAILAENLDTSIGAVEDVEKFLDLPVLGIIPHAESDEKTTSPDTSKKIKPAKENKRHAKVPQLIPYFSSKSPFVESYHIFQTNLKLNQVASPQGGGKVIVFTSSGIGEGKTITTSNFALVSAQSGIKTLLIEADLRRPSLHKLFGVPRGPGFSDCIYGTNDWRSALRKTTDFIVGNLGMEKMLNYPGIENLSLLTAGSPNPNPIDLLNSPRFNELLTDLSSNFELIVVDCPPVLLFADALIAASKATGTIIVYQTGRIGRRTLKRTKDQLVNIKANLLGIVLNNVRTSEMSNFYGYGYYYSYKYYTKAQK
jgi:capsular exopolysaccharide synthesis family protein